MKPNEQQAEAQQRLRQFLDGPYSIIAQHQSDTAQDRDIAGDLEILLQQPASERCPYCDSSLGCAEHDAQGATTGAGEGMERDERYFKVLASAISNAVPTSTEEGNNSHYVLPKAELDALVSVHREIAKRLWGAPATVAEGPPTEATQVAVEAAAREVAQRGRDLFPNHLSVDKVVQIISKHCADTGEVERLRIQNRQLKAIVDIGTSDDPGTAIAKIRNIERTARANAIRECVNALRPLSEAKAIRKGIAALQSLTKKEGDDESQGS